MKSHMEYEYEHFIDITKTKDITFEDYAKITMDSWPKLYKSEKIAYCTFTVTIILFIILVILSGILHSRQLFIFTLTFPIISFAITIFTWKFRDNKIHRECNDKILESVFSEK